MAQYVLEIGYGTYDVATPPLDLKIRSMRCDILPRPVIGTIIRPAIRVLKALKRVELCEDRQYSDSEILDLLRGGYTAVLDEVGRVDSWMLYFRGRRHLSDIVAYTRLLSQRMSRVAMEVGPFGCIIGLSTSAPIVDGVCKQFYQCSSPYINEGLATDEELQTHLDGICFVDDMIPNSLMQTGCVPISPEEFELCSPY